MLAGWLADDPEDRPVLGMLAMYYQAEGLDAQASGAYERLTQSGEPNLIVLNNLACLYQKPGDERALETARKAYDLDPNRTEVADTYGGSWCSRARLRRGYRSCSRRMSPTRRTPRSAITSPSA